MRRIVIFLALVSLVTVAACSNKEKADRELLLQTVQRNADAMNTEDLAGYMSTIDPESPSYEGTKKMLEGMFATYDLTATIESAKILKYKSSEAAVEIVQLTKKKSGPEFRDNRLKMISTFSKTPDGWKMIKSDIIKTEYLDEAAQQ
jgi:ketosteroid isomerase-like protein